ncbi:transposase [Xenorhabdus szentirmaii]|uniref:Uncharacterized protein n=1 Tax=Xenorhabdus szentirmaii DSM 16338 TaxID=1427518 RepID=W1J0T7_9GAMM|nr:transposase [Xenorhabdus szentirmaii DSM 16338]PHM42705.1 transposase [Xenorhabdus szentirmaii]CDL84342.1 hypothetical protein XSR1_450015 [Xenorhabdus szentirmaii DSM 16338]
MRKSRLSQYKQEWLLELFIAGTIYSPWVNAIEKLWLALHETMTRNHCCSYILFVFRVASLLVALIHPSHRFYK